MTNETIFPEGFSVFEPHAKAPDFVKYDISIEPKKFIEFLKNNKQYMSQKGYFKITIKVGKNGSAYAALDTYKPELQSREMQEGVSYNSPVHDAVGGYPEGPSPESVPF